jgi:hypothetical protein
MQAHTAMVFNKPSPFSTHEWMTVPFKDQPSNAHQHLADILFLVPNYMRMLNVGGSMRSFFARPIPPGVDTKPVEERTRELLLDLDKWAIRCPHFTVLPTSTNTHGLSDDMETLITTDARHDSPNGSVIVVPASFMALTAATYEATRLILLMLLMKVSQPAIITPVASPASSSPPLDLERLQPTLFDIATMSSKHILKISAYMESMHPVGFDFIRSVFPLVVVGILGPRPKEKKAAQDMLDRWGKMKGMAGLCSAWLQA